MSCTQKALEQFNFNRILNTIMLSVHCHGYICQIMIIEYRIYDIPDYCWVQL